MELKKLDMPLSVIQVDNLSDIDLSVTPLFLGKTEDELSVVLPTKNVPSITVSREDDWQGFKIEGVLDFSLVGILAKIASLLAAATISIFAISTYNTDYILVKRHDFDVFFLNATFIKSRESNSEINRDLILFRLMKTQCFDFILLLFDVTEITSTDNHSRIFLFSLIIKE